MLGWSSCIVSVGETERSASDRGRTAKRIIGSRSQWWRLMQVRSRVREEDEIAKGNADGLGYAKVHQ